MQEIKDNNVYINTFDNISELCSYLQRPRKFGRDNASEHNDYDFTGTYSYEEAVDLLKYNDDNLYQEIQKEKKKMNIDKIVGNVIQRKQYKNDIIGFQPNVPAYLNGSPLNMINEEKRNTSLRIINIFINVRVAGAQDKEEVTRMGIFYLTMLEVLEKAGYRVNLYVGSANDVYPGSMLMLLKIKTDREPLNLKKTCFPIAHVGFLRRIKFRWMEVCDGPDATGGYGQWQSPNKTKTIIKEKLGEDFLIFNYENDDFEMSEEYIYKLLEENGIKIERNNL